MDHLPYPPNPICKHIRIPVLSSETPSPWSYTIASRNPQTRSRYAYRHYIRPILDLTTPDKQAARIQEDIYFGFLSGFLGNDFKFEDFVRQGAGDEKAEVTIMRLEGILKETYKIQGELSTLEIALLGDFYLVTNGLEVHLRDQNPTNDDNSLENLELVVLSLIALRWTLSSIFFQAERSTYISPLLRKRMLKAGWCPYWAEVHLSRHSIPLLYYLSATPIQPKSLDCTAEDCFCNISNDDTEVRHSRRCISVDNCRLLGPSSKKLRRMIKLGQIPLIRFSLSEDAVGNNHAKTWTRPASTSRGSKNGYPAQVKMKLVKYTPGMVFTAISHVWSGGLGNPKFNVLPQCQLLDLWKCCFVGENKSRIWEHLDDVHLPQNRPLLFWMDTLCIPTYQKPVDETTITKGQKTHGRRIMAAKRKAIDTMAFVYSAADNVVVIDVKMQDVDFEKMPDIDIATTMLCCPWMQRSWTFQEACLAREFWFVLNNRLVSPRRWLGKWESYYVRVPGIHDTVYPSNAGIFPADRSRTVFEMRLKFECLSYLRGICGSIDGSLEALSFENYDVERDHQGLMEGLEVLFRDTFGKTNSGRNQLFTHVWNYLATRRTTQPEDVQSILAVMFGLSVEEIYWISKPGGSKRPKKRRNLLPAAENTGEKPAGTDTTRQARDPDHRMLAILLSQSSLPLRMITHAYTGKTKFCADYRWMPTAPALCCSTRTQTSGHLPLDFEDGAMTWNEELRGWKWELDDTKSVVVLQEELPASLSNTFCLTQRSPTAGGLLHTKIFLLGDDPIPTSQTTNSQIAFFLHGFLTSNEGHGACLRLPRPYDEISTILEVEFLCPIEWSTCKSVHSSDRKTALAVGDLYFGLSCIIPCRNADLYKTTYRRPLPSYIQRKPLLIIRPVIMGLWAIIPGVTIFRERRLRWLSERLPLPFLKRSRDALIGGFFSRQIAIIRWPLYPLFSTFCLWALALEFGLPSIWRIAIFDDWESNCGRRIYDSYYTHLAEQGYYGSDPKKNSKGVVEDRLLFQYPTIWHVACPILASGTFLIATSSYVPWLRSPFMAFPALTKLFRSFAMSLLLETATRVAGECIWRQWWLNVDSKPALQTPPMRVKEVTSEAEDNEEDEPHNGPTNEFLQILIGGFQRGLAFWRWVDLRISGPEGYLWNYRGDVLTE